MSRRTAVVWGPVLVAWLLPGAASAEVPERTRAVVVAGTSEPLARLKKRGDAGKYP